MTRPVHRRFFSSIASAALGLLVVLPTIAEPLVYIARTHRGDIGLVDPITRGVIGGIPAEGAPSVVKIAPDGTYGYVGYERDQTRVLDTLSGQLIEPDRSWDLPDEIDQILFHPELPLAYMSGESGVAIVDTNTHQIIDSLPSFARPALLHLDLEQDVLVAINVHGDIEYWWLDSGYHHFSPASVPKVSDMVVEPSRYFLLTEDEILSFSLWRPAHSASEPREPAAIAFYPEVKLDDLFPATPHLGPALQLELALAKGTIYVGFEGGIKKVECLNSNSTGATNCPGTDGSHGGAGSGVDLVVSTLDLTGGGDERGLEGHMADMIPYNEGRELLVLGNRTGSLVDTATMTLIKELQVRSGTGPLGPADLAPPVASCEAASTSILGFIRAVNALNTGQGSKQKLISQAKAARDALKAGDMNTGRLKLQGLVWRTIERSNLAPGAEQHIAPEDASELVCAVANMIARIDAAH